MNSLVKRMENQIKGRKSPRGGSSDCKPQMSGHETAGECGECGECGSFKLRVLKTASSFRFCFAAEGRALNQHPLWVSAPTRAAPTQVRSVG